RTAPAGTVSMLPRRQEGCGQIITKPPGKRETAAISSGDQVNEDARQPTSHVATICLVAHARFRGKAMSFRLGSEERLRRSLSRRVKKRANRSTPRIGTTTSWNSGM